MSALGQTRSFGDVRSMSELPSLAVVERTSAHGSKVPFASLRAAANSPLYSKSMRQSGKSHRLAATRHRETGGGEMQELATRNGHDCRLRACRGASRSTQSLRPL